MRRLDRIISNKIIHDPNSKFLYQGRNLIHSSAGNIKYEPGLFLSTTDSAKVAYSMKKENEALSNYLDNDSISGSFPNGLKTFFQSKIDENKENSDQLFRKIKSD